MSNIFDALVKSEAERSGTDFSALATATELLEGAERQAVAERETVVQSETTVAPRVVADYETPPPLQAAPSFLTTLEFPAATEPAATVSQVNPFSQFQSLPVQVPPQSRLVCVTDKESLAAEKFRFLGVRLRQLRQGRPLKKVLITSAIPQEGKSMVAANLACTLARRTQQKTLLLEGDLRRPSLSQMFGLGEIPGICEWLQGESSPMTSIYQLDGPGLWILPAGSTPGNPLELMQSGRLSALMDQLTAWFDWIIIDSPPVLPLADTSVWTRLADGILLVTRQGTTEKQQLQRGLEALESKKLIGVLLNCSTHTTHGDYYYHYRSPIASQPNDGSTK
jgi:capsular exopolysaccharide synthesis family protein